MQIVFARHGNTFDVGDSVVWVGARTDLPLVERGREQAAAIALGLMRADLIPTSILTGPLRRTLDTATIIACTLEIPKEFITTVRELREIDYGEWEGRTNSEIRAMVGDGPIDGWQMRSIWPRGVGWFPEEMEILSNWKNLISTIKRSASPDERILIISSNGIFRVIARTLGIDPSNAKINTGFVSQLSLDKGHIRVISWNIEPDKLATV